MALKVVRLDEVTGGVHVGQEEETGLIPEAQRSAEDESRHISKRKIKRIW